jgi:hypothetical protein
VLLILHANPVETWGGVHRSAQAGVPYKANDMQVLMATELKRTDSMLSPQLFHFDDHFEFEEIIGRSHMSEVG